MLIHINLIALTLMAMTMAFISISAFAAFDDRRRQQENTVSTALPTLPLLTAPAGPLTSDCACDWWLEEEPQSSGSLVCVSCACQGVRV